MKKMKHLPRERINAENFAIFFHFLQLKRGKKNIKNHGEFRFFFEKNKIKWIYYLPVYIQ